VKALIDAHMLGADETGNETYIRGLLQGLLEIGAPQAVAVRESGLREFAHGAGAPAHVVRLLRHSSDVARLLADLPELARSLGASLVHCTYVAPPRCPVPTVVTVHDVSFVRFPEAFTWRDRALLGTAVPYSARRARAVITPSEHARREVVELLGVPERRVHVTPEACGPEFRPVAAAERATALRRCGLDGPYVLSLGNLQPRKNLRRLLEAWRRLQDARCLDGHRLVLAGGAHGKREPVARLVAEAGLGDSVLFPGYVPQADLPALYSGAATFVYPSLYEGFGLPVLEAMACGAPVACSNAASLPEVAGDAALLFDPLDTEGIAASLGALLADEGLRAALVARGFSRAAGFSWAACARRTLAAYEAALA
jgi:glycosyltransferase involved in cell wall biosynthesis